jgi:phenolic acid decarboxylase
MQGTEQDQASDFPAAGHVFEVNFGGDYVFNLDFKSDTQMTYTGQVGAFVGVVDTVAITAVKIRPGVYMIYWTESDQTEIVHVEDYDNGVVYTNITPPGKQAVHFKGTLKQID